MKKTAENQGLGTRRGYPWLCTWTCEVSLDSMDQADFIRRIAEAPGMFAWFLGAGASQSAGLPTATDVIWDLKRRYYCSEEHQEISANDLQTARSKKKSMPSWYRVGFQGRTTPRHTRE